MVSSKGIGYIIGLFIGGALLGIVYAILGALSLATVATVLAGGGYLLGFLAFGTAKTIWLGLLGLGAVGGLIVGALQLLLLEEKPKGL